MHLKITCWLLFFPMIAFSQLADSIALPVVEVEAPALRSNLTGTRNEQWDSKKLNALSGNNLSELLQQESGVFIKSYGIGSSATVALRGGSAGHTAVLWNGLPLQSPMLGLLDFSLMPVSFLDKVDLQYGGNSSAWGSGAIGGVIALDNKLKEKTTSVEINSSAGSFGLLNNQLKASYNFGKWTGITRLFQKSADNNFTYQIREDIPIINQSNAQFEQQGILQELYYLPTASRTGFGKGNQELSIRFWGQKTDRQIPPNSAQTRSLASQKDESLRGSIHWKSIQDKWIWNAKSGLFRESIHYQDTEYRIDALSYFWSALGEANAEYFISENQQLSFGVSHIWTFADIENYGTPPQQNRTALFGAFQQRLKDWTFQLNSRYELVDEQLIPTAPSLGIEKKINRRFLLRGKVSNNYRLPTFNDLYWNPGGNLDLLPESGWSQEIGVEIPPNPLKGGLAPESKAAGKVSSPWRSGGGLTLFNRNIKNWIYWTPADGKAFWTPRNLTKVWSRGIEVRVNLQKQIGELKGEISAGYDWVLSTNQIAVDRPDIEKGEQLWYVPKHQFFSNLNLKWRNIEFAYFHNYTGQVRSPNDNLLEDYHISNANLSYAFHWKQLQSRLFFATNNLWNTNYNIIEYRPMPGKNYELGLRLKFKKNKS